MWIMSTTGFFSAVEHRDDESLLMVRCRVEGDARYIARKTGAKVVRSHGLADYEYRVTITKSQYAAFVVGEILGIQYSNFKDQIKKQQGAKRANVYMRVWSALASLQPLAPYVKVPLAATATTGYVWDGPRGGRQTNWWSDEVEGGLARLENENELDANQDLLDEIDEILGDGHRTKKRGTHGRKRRKGVHAR